MTMKTKTIEVCDAIHINVNCKENDWDDIKIGGPATLGYEFYVSPDEDIEALKKTIKGWIKKYKRPFLGINHRVRKDFPIEYLWTHEKMEECIRNNAIC